MTDSSRRRFLQTTAAATAAAGFADWSFLSQLSPVQAQDAKLAPDSVRFRPEIEPLVRLIEETPRDELMEKVAGRLREGLSYRELLAALLLAGVRNVQPRPSVGFKFHAVLVVNSAHLASISSPDEDRWLPIFWALDEFKSSQARDVREGNWTMSAVDEPAVPAPSQAPQAFQQAMDRWDELAADAAVAGLARNAGAGQVLELFARYGARDFRSIGHKAIFVANSWRTLQCIGWRHSEPVLRSLAYALLNHEGDPNPAKSDLSADRPWRENEARAKQIRESWLDGKADPAATTELLATLRGSEADACDQVVEMLNRGVAPQSIYDALFLGAGELLMRQPGIVALHAVTSTNALHFAFQAVASDDTRRMLLLQNAAFLVRFRQAMQGRGEVGDDHIDELAGAELSKQDEEAALHSIFQTVSQDRGQAARDMLGFLEGGASPESLINAARRLIFLKGNDSHDYKYSSAVLEDYYHLSPQWRDRFLASAAYRLCGAGERDNGLINRIRDALA